MQDLVCRALKSKDGSSGFGNLRQRPGRSPGKGDAVVMCWSEGNAAAVSRHNAWKWEKYRHRPQRESWIWGSAGPVNMPNRFDAHGPLSAICATQSVL